MPAPDPSKPPATAPPPYSAYPSQNTAYPPVPPGYGPHNPDSANQVAPAYGFQPQQLEYPPQQGYSPQAGYPQPGYPPAPGYGATVITMPPVAPEVIILNGCPTCRNGILEEDFTCCGLLCGILFFPLGLLCCFLMRERRCTNCRTQF